MILYMTGFFGFKPETHRLWQAHCHLCYFAAMQEAAAEQLTSVRSDLSLYKQQVQACSNLEC